MAILGYDTKGASQVSGVTPGRMYVSKFTLAAGGSLTELHGWFTSDGAGSNLRLLIYDDDGTSGNPGTRLGYTSPISIPLGDYHASETGLSITLAAGDYWLGWLGVTVVNNVLCYGETSGGTHVGRVSGAPDPPANPFGTTDTSGSRKHSVWAVVAAAGPPVANFTGTPLTGTASLSVAFTDSSTNSPTSWAWTFGDGGTSSSQNPTHSYTTSGVYTVVLVATNASGSDTKTRTAYISVSETVAYAAGGGIDIY